MSGTAATGRTAGEGPVPAGTLRSAVTGAAVAVAVVGVVTVAVYGIAALKDTAFRQFSRDPAAALDGPLYTGYYSNMVIVIWLVAATVPLFGALLLREAGRPGPARFLLVAGLLTAAMGLDDLFLLHEAVYPALGVPQDLVFVVYAVVTAVFAWRFRHRLGPPGLLLVAAAYACWGFSVALDATLHLQAPITVEDGVKAAGVAVWALLLLRHTHVELRGVLRPGPA